MKRLCFILPLFLSSQLLLGQVILRNDFVIHHKTKWLENKGITHIMFNVGARNMWNLNAYGQPIKSMTIDLTALTARREYSYREIAEKIYQPGAVFRQAYIPIPLFLLLEPPRAIKWPRYAYLSQRSE
jgi:hypothetical protein